MSDLDLLHFEQLKNEVQTQYLENHTPSFDDISKWKGIDIIYFQEDLRKIAKGNISEKSFYTYFKNSPVTKLPRIDMLNILCVYAGYASWYDFKKNHLFADEILKEHEDLADAALKKLENEQANSEVFPITLKESEKNDKNPLNSLTNKELEIALLYIKGQGNLEICNSLNIKKSTVSTFKSKIFDKLGVTNIPSLVEIFKLYYKNN